MPPVAVGTAAGGGRRAPAPAQANGAIFQAAAYRPLFEDHRARLVGDTLTVQIVEKVSASQKSTSSIDKSGSPRPRSPRCPASRQRHSFAAPAPPAAPANTFDGKGATESSNDFCGTITVVVHRVLPNGHLMIAGEKQIGVNDNVDVLRFSGQVDPRSIQPGNAVPSAQSPTCASSTAAAASRPRRKSIGWLSRFFLTCFRYEPPQYRLRRSPSRGHRWRTGKAGSAAVA